MKKGAFIGTSFRPIVGRLLLAMAVVFVLPLVTCSLELPALRGHPPISAIPGENWVPPPGEKNQAPNEAASIPLDLAARQRNWTLVDVVDLTLRNNPATKVAWENARSAAAELGVQQGQVYPSVGLELTASGSDLNIASQGLPAGAHVVFGPSLTLSYLLIDFGGRSASIEAARQALLAADWTQNQVLQDSVLLAELAYFRATSAKALLESNRSIVDEARASLDSAKARVQAGSAAIADELQARTALLRARLALKQTEGLVRISRGALAASMGLPANTDFDIQTPNPNLPVSQIANGVDRLIEQALRQRPELAAAKAHLASVHASVQQAHSMGLPTLSLSASAGLAFLDRFSEARSLLLGNLAMHVPIFSGLSQSYAELEAEAKEGVAGELERSLRIQISLDVYTAYIDTQIAAERVEASVELLAVAQQSSTVALGRYQAGVGTIVELLTAQASLADAAAEDVEAHYDWLASMVQLAHAMGLLGLQGDLPLLPNSDASKEEKP